MLLKRPEILRTAVAVLALKRSPFLRAPLSVFGHVELPFHGEKLEIRIHGGNGFRS